MTHYLLPGLGGGVVVVGGEVVVVGGEVVVVGGEVVVVGGEVGRGADVGGEVGRGADVGGEVVVVGCETFGQGRGYGRDVDVGTCG